MLNPEQPLINKRVTQYVQLRDKIKQMDAEHKEKMAPFRKLLDDLNASIMAQLNAISTDEKTSVRTDSGTAYKSKKTSASIADGKLFRDYVIANGAWDLLDWKANSTAVADHVEEFKAPPPGLNYSVTYVAGVRRK
jgi:hypothetical protein